ncbi:XRE family transcriptional regulator [Chryseolinea sp. T2]|uniref:XRE family transcriptional regulator n=1 Tax=Chryseolinea sp. T2 TaxID=3129255 RepID=UPI0030781578
MAMINKNLKFLRGQQGLTQKQLAEKLGLKQAAIGAYEEERATPPLASLLDLSKIFNVNLDDLVRQDLSKSPEKERKRIAVSRGREVLAITVDSQNRENVELVTQKASAGYMSGYQDVEFVKELPKISLPVLPRNRTYRAFEIQGDSMIPIQPGSIIFGEYLESIDGIKNGKLYIIMTRQDGIVFKRVFNLSEDKSKLLLVSDNRQYAPYTVDASDVLEIWTAKAFFTNQFPDAQIAPSPVTDNMAHTIVQLQEELSRLRRK